MANHPTPLSKSNGARQSLIQKRKTEIHHTTAGVIAGNIAIEIGFLFSLLEVFFV